MHRRLGHVRRFYDILSLLESHIGGARILSACHGRLTWPQRGVYFFLEPGEVRTDSGQGLRVVRVGTRALTGRSRSTLWKRLSQHVGTRTSGGGNHRGSIFRLLVGSTLLDERGASCPTWGRGSNAAPAVRAVEASTEQDVSAIIGAMSVLWLPVNDRPGSNSLRGHIERTASPFSVISTGSQ